MLAFQTVAGQTPTNSTKAHEDVNLSVLSSSYCTALRDLQTQPAAYKQKVRNKPEQKYGGIQSACCPRVKLASTSNVTQVKTGNSKSFFPICKAGLCMNTQHTHITDSYEETFTVYLIRITDFDESKFIAPS